MHKGKLSPETFISKSIFFKKLFLHLLIICPAGLLFGGPNEAIAAPIFDGSATQSESLLGLDFYENNIHASWADQRLETIGVEATFTPSIEPDAPIEAQLIGLGLACSRTDNAPDASGHIALIPRGDCDFVEKVSYAEAAGAIAVIVYDNQDEEEPMVMGGFDPVAIPSVMIDMHSGEQLQAALDASETVSVRMSHRAFEPAPPEEVESCIRHRPSAMAPGFSYAIMENGELTHSGGYGQKDLVEGGAVDSDTMFRIANLSEAFLATAILMQAEAGHIDLDAPITTILPELTLRQPWSADDISMRHLLDHRSGLADKIDPILAASVGLERWMDEMPQWPVFGPPDIFYYPARVNYGLAGLALERVAGLSVEDHLEEVIFEPAGMFHTTLKPEKVLEKGNFAKVHAFGQRFAPDEERAGLYRPSIGAYSSAKDLTRWAQLLMNEGEDIVPAEVVEQLLDQPGPADALHRKFGRGIFHHNISKGTSIDVKVQTADYEQNFGNGTLRWVPEKGLAVAVVSNGQYFVATAANCLIHKREAFDKLWQFPSLPPINPRGMVWFEVDLCHAPRVWSGFNASDIRQCK